MGKKSRLGNQPAGQKEKAAERRVKALDLRQSGLSYRKIAEQLEVDVATVFRDIKDSLAELKAVEETEAEELRIIEVARLDAILNAMYNKAINGDQGAVDRVLRIMERRAKLLGLDAPSKTDVTSGGQPLTFKVVYADEVKSLDADGSDTD
ncbi:MAG TPA: hypothetical protein VHP83_18715 [Aggregatilineaceae bacterium]|nr:hypothetical protein [Aggregatilineaceae bacterium]